ncbi:hypothetical protein RTG_01406 [Rhodotorula toruloides ATCC 204091]|uniref:SacI homology domain-domain containing protein n=1 Tax=Rhodotorula toruloides TaxID=5286 RepID=A0A0K3CHX6_RHOTO|nr:hypothetical protein RTG_01406 [Rhodotorula toruloides ATCC 204091]PRQ73906.1 SacI homology domain-domain containing protein [Rhodotorula toruloides]
MANASPGSWSRANARTVPPAVSAPPLALLHRRLAIHPDPTRGLVVRPYDASFRGLWEGQAVRIPYGSTKPEETRWKEEQDVPGIEVDCVAGLLVGFQDSFLIVVTDSTVTATLPDLQNPHSRPKILSANSLLAIPLGSYDAAKTVIMRHLSKQAARRKRSASVASTASATSLATGEGAASMEEDTSEDESSADEADAAPIVLPQAGEKAKRPFWQRTFSRGFGKKPCPAPPAVASAEETSTEKVDDPNTASPPNATDAPDLPAVAATATEPSSTGTGASTPPDDEEVRESQRELDEKLVAECLRVFTGLYFSFNTDITRGLQAKHERRNDGLKHLPLWRSADKRFWFNQHLLAPFVQAGLHSYIVVMMQGFAQHLSVALPLQPYRTLTSVDPSSPTSVDLDLTLISRRSTERPGLRYQRRGIDSSGSVANFVETEFIVECVREGTRHVDSFVQVRGSIPLYWSQSPWALKPPPVLERTEEESRKAMRKHLDGLRTKYGRLVLVNLAETTGKEGTVVNAYGEGVKSLSVDEEEMRYVSFDFHKETKGFNYARISNLIEDIKHDLEEMQTFWTTPEDVYSMQKGACRVNCIDSLDRTNVVESAIARWVLNQHLIHLGITSGEEAGMHDDLDFAFNALWADNGDAISREYAGTSALKGDFTRTGKRNWRGAMNDASNSVARLLQSTVTDFFKQAALDYMLGVNLNAFQEFAERLETSDPGEIIRLAQIRQEALETATREVMEEGEHRVAACTLLSPTDEDTVRPAKGGKYEEKVLILSDKAVYIVSYEFSLQKVTSFTRIPTGDILGLQAGVYIISSLDASARDPLENYGFIIRYRAKDTTERVRTYSLRTSSPRKSPAKGTSSSTSSRPLTPLKLPFPIGKTTATAISTADSSEGETHYVAFKALRRDAVKVAREDGSSEIIDRRAGDDIEGKTAKDVVWSIVRRLKEECEKVGAAGEGDDDWLVEKDIISLAESKAQTSIVDKLSHSLYKAIWA